MSFRNTLLLNLTMACAFTTVFALAQVASAQDSQLGSTITLEQLQSGNKQSAVAKAKARDAVLTVQAADEPTPSLRYRFWPDVRERHPGSAYLRFSRAITMFLQVPKNQVKEWGEHQIAHEDDLKDAKDIAKVIAPFRNVLSELEEFAKCEDTAWDHRLRDLRGPGIYAFLLPEIQESRSLARLLRYRAVEQLQQGDFEGLFATIRTGYQLAFFLRSGETLVQQLVGIAIEGVMQGVVMEAIQTPGCPNLYWALATVQHSSQPMQRALEIELSIAERVLPALDGALDAQTDQGTWAKKWQESVSEMNSLVGDVLDADMPSIGLSVVVALQTSTGAADAKERLLEAGIARAKVESMCAEQAIAMDAVLELRTWHDRLMRNFYLPFSTGSQLRKQADDEFNDWITRNKTKSVAAVLAGLVFPAVYQAAGADVRVVAMHNRLMTIEAVRYYAELHHGHLPRSLEDLEQLPAMIDPFTNNLVGYTLTEEKGVEVGSFTVEAPNLPDEMKTIRIKIAK